MNAFRMLLYVFGIILVIGALAIFFFETGLDRWVPVSLLLAGILLIVGMAIMGFAQSAPSDRRVAEGSGDDVTVIRK